jgi:glycosyltransferase involved in cell wall biosynthesis
MASASDIDTDLVALFVPTLGYGGVERVFVNLSRGLSDEGLKVDLIVGNAAGEFFDFVPRGVQLIDLRVPRVSRALFPLARYLRKARPRAVVAAMTHSSVIGVLARKLARVNTRTIATEHAQMSCACGPSERWRVRLSPVAARYVYPWADSIVAVSQGVADDLVQTAFIKREKIVVIPNPVLTPDLYRQAAEPLNDPWFGAGQKPVVLSVGRLTAPKDFLTLIRAFALVRAQTEARLLILGEGPDRTKLEALIEQHGLGEDVRLHGYEPNPYKYMVHSAAFALSSAWEGFAIVLVEALALGLPVISTDCPSGPREILQNGLGLLAPVGDAGALAEGITRILNSPPPQVPTPALEAYQLRSVVQQYLQLI